MGFILGSLLGAVICYHTGLQVPVILLMSLTGAATFFLLAFGTKAIAGKEIIVYYHHEISILIMCTLVLKVTGLPVLPYLDISILGIATFLAFGRIGCFSVGCCHGKPNKRGVVYGHDHVKAGFTYYYEGIPLLPVQLIESVFVFVIIICSSIILFLHCKPGTVLILYTVVYGTFRFILEFFRGDAERPYFRGLSEAQWTTLLLIAISILFGIGGLLPLYNWHIIMAASLFVGSIIVILRNSLGNKITNPRHVRQIAIALNKIYSEEFSLPDKQKSQLSVNIFQTNLGLKLSKGQLTQMPSFVNHYTISSKAKTPLTYPVVQKLAILIQQLQKHNTQFEIYEKQHAVFHILFKE